MYVNGCGGSFVAKIYNITPDEAWEIGLSTMDELAITITQQDKANFLINGIIDTGDKTLLFRKPVTKIFTFAIVFLIFFAVLVLLFIVSKLKRSQMQALDCFFWLVFCLCFVLMAIFPDFTEFISRCFGFMSASNFVFLFVIEKTISTSTF